MPLLGETVRIRRGAYNASDAADLALIDQYLHLIDRLTAYSPGAWREDALQGLRLVILLKNRECEGIPQKTDVENALRDYYKKFSQREFHHGIIHAPRSFNYTAFVHALYRRTHNIENRGKKVKATYPDSYSTQNYGKCASYVLVKYHREISKELALEYQLDREILRLIRDGDKAEYICRVLRLTMERLDERLAFLGKPVGQKQNEETTSTANESS